ncbi:intermembrane lipid transfer protein Vps13D isoform X2 [Lutzomyia longipalpis]|uniref:intermembrane lipid transfer protein Vps13D isoform X2 n=1 Tax=Lutzomyia longipalpis TaxID=7200 RepID=UPI00248443A3|nr:intermembrane lipid transfer protein Vps13D isoform X2 [Lutzomyia longipalpis]
MLRDLIAWVLNNYLGKYVGNLNTAQLTIALLSGEVELENLPLRRDALRNLGLPLQALSGSVGKIKLQVPVRQFWTAPWCIYIEKVNVVVGPVNLDEWDAEAEEQADLDFKVARLDRLEAKWRAAREASIEGGYYASSYSGWMNFGTSLVTNIVENLQLKISDVHIRYEDSITVPNQRFACGVTVEWLSAQSCDSNWRPGIASGQSVASFKLVELQSLSLYWDLLDNHESFGEVPSSELAAAMEKMKFSHQYIVSPVSAQAKLKRDRSENPLRTRSRPRLVCDLVLEEVSLSLTDWQYNQMVECVRGLDDIAKYRRFHLLRPTHPIHEGARNWWLYAARCHGFLKATGCFVPGHVRDNVRYLGIYSRLIRNPNEVLSAEEKEHKDCVERMREYEELKNLREICMEEVPCAEVKAGKEGNQGRSMLHFWFPQWLGWYSNGATEAAAAAAAKAPDQADAAAGQTAKDQLEDEILNGLSTGVDTNSVLKRDAVFGKFDFTLKKGTLDICSGAPGGESRPMVQFFFENLILFVESRPRSASHLVGLSLGSVLLKDCLTPNTEFPDVIRPQQKEEGSVKGRQQVQKRTLSNIFTSTPQQQSPAVSPSEPLFVLHYERKPLSYSADYRLFVKSQSLDIVYNTGVVKWIVDFVVKPHQMLGARRKLEAMKNRTKKEIIRNWENILEGDLKKRKTWIFEIDISAPQIIVVENFSNKNGTIVVVDFGRLQLTNRPSQPVRAQSIAESAGHRDSEDEDAFMTPCSTPPGSQASTSDSPTLISALGDVPESTTASPLDVGEELQARIYDRYNIDFTDLQVLVCKCSDGWAYASGKGTSNLHVLDRFSISLQLERRVVYTADPQYPSLKLSGSLPKLVVHANEAKIIALRNMMSIVSGEAGASPTVTPTEPTTNIFPEESISDASTDEEDSQREATKLIVLQFAIDQMVLEVQSHGRGIAELQVTGVKAGFSRRAAETNITLSVHGLLLVDAIQSFGPDFELLIASHRHVGIDSVSGSLKQSEPCSPMSPGSPDPTQNPGRPTSPHTISKALSSLQRDALIVVDILFVNSADDTEQLQIANIQFNNLDIIANQETIVELIGFFKGVMPKSPSSAAATSADPVVPCSSTTENVSKEEAAATDVRSTRTEITFDFHRLNVLVLRALLRDTYMVGRKVGTFTMSEARIHATLGKTVTVEGSLGGLQVLDLTPEGINHQRILSVGKDPLTEGSTIQKDLLSSLTEEVYGRGEKSAGEEERGAQGVDQALSFVVFRGENAGVEIKIRMASVWYTHCARFMQELSWCATEFKHYLKNLARSIREKATDMALGFVQQIDQGEKSLKASKDKVDIKLDVVLDTPVLVVPRSSCSPQVFVAHLGKISVNNQRNSSPATDFADVRRRVSDVPYLRKNDSTIFTISEEIDEAEQFNFDENTFQMDDIDGEVEARRKPSTHAEACFGGGEESPPMDGRSTYVIDIRNMNLFSLDTNNRKKALCMNRALPRAEEFYSCQTDGVAILHDTAIRLDITKVTESWTERTLKGQMDHFDTLAINGSVVKPLHLSLTRHQYEQLLETFDNIFKVPSELVRPPTSVPNEEENLDEVEEIDAQVDAAEVPKIPRRLFNQPSLGEKRTQIEPRVTFELPTFVIQLKNDCNRPLIEISFRDFNVQYEKNNQYETSIQVSLRSLLMEDLLQPIDSKNRTMVISSCAEVQNLRPGSAFSSHSCPNLAGFPGFGADVTGSLPENLEGRAGFAAMVQQTSNKSHCPQTPPPSPQPRDRQDNLVIYSSLLVDPECPNFATQYNSLRQSSSIDFNSLDLLISVQSWYVLLNFFGLLQDDESDGGASSVSTTNPQELQGDPNRNAGGDTELNITVRSLTVVLVAPDYEIAKANVSNAKFVVAKRNVMKTVEGHLGSMSLYDLTQHGKIYRERFVTSGNEALNFTYCRDKVKGNARTVEADAKLKIQMASVRYVHTKRFVMEIQAFFQAFSQLQQPVMKKIKPSESRQNLHQRPIQLGLEIKAESPIILLPMSSRSSKVIVADLGEFSLRNSFRWSTEKSVISVQRRGIDETTGKVLSEILDVMSVKLVNTNLFAGTRSERSAANAPSGEDLCLDMGSYSVMKEGPSLLKNKCHLSLQVERNMDAWRSHNVPDFSVQGTLSKLEAVLDLEQYKLVRGFLSYNLGEPTDDLYVEPATITESLINLSTDYQPEHRQVWTNMSITLDLQEVLVKLHSPTNIPEGFLNLTTNTMPRINRGFEDLLGSGNSKENFLACINFIKSSLKIDSFSDGSQDIDLVSQEILVTDTRTQFTAPRNVFTNILAPTTTKFNEDSVQAEVHSRRRQDCSKYTILLNNMRLMAILDWLESIRDFLSQSEEAPKELVALGKVQGGVESPTVPTAVVDDALELVLNITNSELVFVENTDQWDTNAVILKSTTIVSFRPSEINKVMSLNLNNLEVFSCTLDAEDTTALSIIDPVTINLDIRKGVLDLQLQKRLCIRLSYHDVKMFTKMLQSLPKQTKQARSGKEDAATSLDIDGAVKKLSALGFKRADCVKALELCSNQLDDAALWLTQNAEPVKSIVLPAKGPLEIQAVEIRAACISICVIDDCKDADVPLLELSLSHLDLRQELGGGGVGSYSAVVPAAGSESIGFRAGHLSGVFASDYYNRRLSGWEPVIEAWRCQAEWSYSLGQIGTHRNRLHLQVASEDLLKVNVTNTLIDLYQVVRENWTEDYFAQDARGVVEKSPQGHRRRTPFVPFALRNDTGIALWFTTLVSSPDGVPRRELLTKSETRWQLVAPGAVQPFSFGGAQNKLRHHDSHKLNLHQVGVRVDGWTEVGPVSVDRVGTYFRHAHHGASSPNDSGVGATVRIVFEVTMEGSAQKLVTVRSSLQVVNRLSQPCVLKMEHLYGPNVEKWPETLTAVVRPHGGIYSVPLSHVHAFIFLKPLPALPVDHVEAWRGDEAKTKSRDYWTTGQTVAVDKGGQFHQFSDKPFHWKELLDSADVQQELRTCKSNRERWFHFVVAIEREKYPQGSSLPGHTFVLYPPVRLYNLLPCDLLWRVPGGSHGRVSPSETAAIHEVDLTYQIELTIALDGYPGSGHIVIPAGYVGRSEMRLKLTDVNHRLLFLRGSVQVEKGQGVQITVSAPFWLVNRTGLPLIFRQEGVNHDSSGQFSEHEQARLVSPLMFSFSDFDAPPALTVRLGKRYGMNPTWCQPFNLHKDTLNRQLRSGVSNETFVIGIDVRRGRGRYAKTSVVTFSPRFQLYNRSRYKLQFAQKYFATTLTDPLAKSTFIEAVPDCHLPFHWPRLDKEQELCVRLPDVQDCLWSGGVPIQESLSVYINIRNANGDMHFIRLEIVLQGATYFLLFGDAQALPPPIRIDNFSEVPVKFHQPGGKHQWRTVVRAHASMAYALDEPTGVQAIQVEAPGGVCHTYHLRDLETPHNLTYENFIYIAFSGTFKRTSDVGLMQEPWDYDVENQQLVLGVLDGRVFLVRKRPGDRTQLWRMNQDKQLEHEGSSPPTEPGKRATVTQRFVLDLDGPPRPMSYVNLVVRPIDIRRKSTQTWRFTEEGRLMCEHSNMCVQPKNGFFGLRPGCEAVLGMIVSDTHVITESLVPLEQAIERQKMRPGSGCLSVVVTMDGPIRTVRIRDVNSKRNSSLAIDPAWKHVSHVIPHFNTSLQEEKENPEKNSIDEFHIYLKLSKGIGISIVSRQPCEELALISLENITLEAVATPSVRSLDLSVDDVQVDNQLLETPCQVALYTIKPASTDSPTRSKLSALQLTAKMLPSPNANAVIFEHLILSLRPMSIYLEERLMLRMADFMGLGRVQADAAALTDESDYEAHRVATQLMATNVKRYYFGDLQIVVSQNRLSVITATKLTPRMGEMKRRLGLTLIKFEDAIIEFEKFTDKHHFETLEVYLGAIKSHYKKELKWQAGSILGSVDFLGNPLGFANDVSEGVSGLIFEGSVKSLVKNVTHGISNSTAKLTETLSDGLGRVVLDDEDTETRQRILSTATTTNSTDHLVAGLKGLGFGLLGGVTSIVKHTYSGAQTDGIQGLISGFGMGLVGTVTKPVIGMLDLAAETASAVRETSKSSNRQIPDRKRLPRCVTGAPGSLLPPYSYTQGKGQSILYTLNRRDFTEQLMAYEPCLFDGEDSKLELLVSTENVWVFSRNDDATTIIFTYHLSDLLSCHPVSVTADPGGHHKSKKTQHNHYIELGLTVTTRSATMSAVQENVKRPRVRCQSEDIAQRASRHINYAKGIYDEREQTLYSDSVMD